MKIAVVFDTMIWGGIERVGISYVDLLIKAGHTVDAYVLSDKTESIIEELKALCPVTVKNINPKLCPENCWYFPMYHDFGGIEMAYFAVCYWGLKICRSITKPFRRIRGKQYDLAIAFSGHIKDLTFVVEDCILADRKLTWLHGTQYQHNLLSPGFYRLYKKVKNLVCLSEVGDADCTQFNLKHGIRKRKIYNPCVVNTSGVDAGIVAQLKQTYGDFCLMVGRLAEDKDQETVIRAMQYLKEELGLKKNLVLVGDGPKRHALEEFVRQCGMEDSVFFAGTRSDVQNYYTAATLYVHGSPLEGLPTVFLEAMAFDLPIATTEALAGGREILGNNDYGLISPNWAPPALAVNIKRLYDDESLRASLIEKGRQRVQDFAPQKVLQQLLDFLDEISR